MTKRFRVYPKDADFVQDTKSGAMWLVKQSSPRTDLKVRAPEPDYLAELLVEELNIRWPLREYHMRWDDKEMPVWVGETAYHTHHVIAKPGKLVNACGSPPAALNVIALDVFAPLQVCIGCIEFARDIEKRGDLLLLSEFTKLRGL